MTETAEPTKAKARRSRSKAAKADGRGRPPPRRSRPCGSSRPGSCAAGTHWAREPVIRLPVDLGVLEDFPSNKIPGFNEALVALIPTLEDHACSLGRRGGFITRLRDGTWAGHIAEHVALEFQNLAGTDVRHGKTRSAGIRGQYDCIYEFREETVGVEAGRMAPLRSSITLCRARATLDNWRMTSRLKVERLIRPTEIQAFINRPRP